MLHKTISRAKTMCTLAVLLPSYGRFIMMYVDIMHREKSHERAFNYSKPKQNVSHPRYSFKDNKFVWVRRKKRRRE